MGGLAVCVSPRHGGRRVLMADRLSGKVSLRVDLHAVIGVTGGQDREQDPETDRQTTIRGGSLHSHRGAGQGTGP